MHWRLLILFAALVFVYCWKSSQIITIPRRFIFPYTPADFGIDYIPVKITTKDRIELDAWFIPTGRATVDGVPTIIICHGFGVDKGDCMDAARFLYNAGYNVVMFDFRAHGRSQGKYCSLGYYEVEDINTVIEWLHSYSTTHPRISNIDTSKIGIIGFSMGGTAALLATAKNPNIKAVVSDGAYCSFWSAVTSFARAHFKAPKYPFIPPAVWSAGLRLRLNPSQINLAKFIHAISPRPALIIHGSEDREIRLADAHQIYSLLTAYNSDNTSLWVVEGAHHLESHYIAKEEYEYRVTEFFNQTFTLCEREGTWDTEN